MNRCALHSLGQDIDYVLAGGKVGKFCIDDTGLVAVTNLIVVGQQLSIIVLGVHQPPQHSVYSARIKDFGSHFYGLPLTVCVTGRQVDVDAGLNDRCRGRS